MLPRRLSLLTAIKLRLSNYLNKFFLTYKTESYSQFGEDITLLNIFKHKLPKKNGIYLDVGCNHPIKYSNTFLLYLNGWRGVTIDLNKKFMRLHKKERKLDKQFIAPISDVKNMVRIFEHSNNLMTTINEEFYLKHKDGFENANDGQLVETFTLNEILSKTDIKHIDLLCIDVEGHDFNVLKSISLEKYKPQVIIIEMHDCSLEKISENRIFNYLKCNGYKMEGFLYWNGYFVREELIQK